MLKQVLINVEDTEIRVACLEDSELVELYIESSEERSIVGNLYKGVVEDIVPGLQAAFVEIGLERRAFLHFSDFHPEYQIEGRSRRPSLFKRFRKPSPSTSAPESTASRKSGRAEEMLYKGQHVLVQVIKEEIGEKACRVTTNVSLPGRYLVLLPFSHQRGGVSRKITNIEERERLKRILNEIRTSEMAFIIRTVGYEATEDEIKRDVGFLQKKWAAIVRQFRHSHAPALVYNDHDIIYRLVRDTLRADTTEITIDSPRHMRFLHGALRQLLPPLRSRVRLFTKKTNVFQEYGVERQIQKALQRKVWLKSGGYVIFDEAEALAAVDVNTGKYVGNKDQEETILQTNMEAAEVIARQLRLRDIGGIIVIDFIDMASRSNRDRVFQEFRKHLKRDRSKLTILPFSRFGLLEMTRKRVRQSLKNIVYTDCPYCSGSGKILAKSQIWRNIKYEVLKAVQNEKPVSTVTVTAHPQIRKYVETEVRDSLMRLQKHLKARVIFKTSETYHYEHFDVRAEP
jgi:ribonuclease G